VDLVGEREPVRRGRMVNRAWGDPAEQLRERHDASDFELRTWDKIAPPQEGSGDA
jgi:GST-like protein